MADQKSAEGHLGSEMGQPAINKRAIDWVCVLALFPAALVSSLRAGMTGALR